jgi:hypothetical protein
MDSTAATPAGSKSVPIERIGKEHFSGTNELSLVRER